MSLRREAAIVAISSVIVELVQLGFDRLRHELNEREKRKKRRRSKTGPAGPRRKPRKS